MLRHAWPRSGQLWGVLGSAWARGGSQGAAMGRTPVPPWGCPRASSCHQPPASPLPWGLSTRAASSPSLLPAPVFGATAAAASCPAGAEGPLCSPCDPNPMGALSSLSAPLSPGTSRDLTCIQQHHELPTNPGTGTWGSVPVRSRPRCRGGGDVCPLIGQMVTAGGTPAPRSLRR